MKNRMLHRISITYISLLVPKIAAKMIENTLYHKFKMFCCVFMFSLYLLLPERQVIQHLPGLYVLLQATP